MSMSPSSFLLTPSIPYLPPPLAVILLFINFSCLKDFIYLILEAREWREKERERNSSVWLPLAHPLLETWPATQACALTGNRTCDTLAHRPVLNPLSFPYNSSIPLLDIYQKKPKTLIRKNISIPMLIAALFKIIKMWKQPKCPSVDEWIKQLWDICTMEYYSAMQEKKILPLRQCVWI